MPSETLFRFPPDRFETQSYTSVLALGPSSAMVLYNSYGDYGAAGFAMRVEFDE